MDIVEDFNQIDTVTYEISATEASTESTVRTRLYNPHNGTVVAFFAILGIAFLIHLYLPKK